LIRLGVFFWPLLIASSVAAGQVVQIGPPDPNYCKNIETIRPNFKLQKQTHIHGRIIDVQGSPLKTSKVELRRFINESKQKTIKTTVSDSNGEFDLGQVKSGEYRLLASPTRGFQQPETLDCYERQNCELNIMLKVNSTDMLESVCPIR
jgi:5-hydroxyisourate hydrolase-like protein (transthyretin family)